MLKIRLQRVGRRNDPSFRLIITDARRGPRSGKFIEVLGSYDARKNRPQIKVERVKHWLTQGAQVSATVHNLLVDVLPPRRVDPVRGPMPKASADAEGRLTSNGVDTSAG